MTRLTVGDETDALHKAAFGIRFVTIIAIEFLAVDRGNVAGEMALMIEAQDVRVAWLRRIDLKLWMVFPERRESPRVSACRARQFEGNALRRLRMAIKVLPVELCSLLRGQIHNRAIVMAGRAIGTRLQFHWAGPLMFLMTRRARAILHDVRLMKGVVRVTGFAFLVDRLEGNAVSETFFDNGAKLFRCERSADRQRFVVAARAVVAKACVFGGNFAGAKKIFAAARLINPDRDQSTDN